ncbi:hypothetical protein GALMADRAFT_259268 [Galerina marginata CBS 339.88]|uniref:Uncharacterized protein n=1 Tax=Galerina marginata (strain CBS 339.88) TaxID=685588 RepID=A0A067SIA7_GALM3|nr:hypothetical protein GALMADRAFT_259268 [Galerina marginata CBS 339.88]
MASTPNGHAPLPELDLVGIARTTRKTLDRLASFSNMQSSSEPLPLLTKISEKILGLIHLIDSSMLTAQLGYQLATDAMILCDPEETDWDADVSVESLRSISVKGCEMSKAVMEGFRDVNQAVYKIAASTKDNMFIVVVPPDPSHSDTMKIHLKDIGTGLVANLNLISAFSRDMTSVAGWWTNVNEDLASESPRLLPSTAETTTGSDSAQKFARWLTIKDGFQQYYNLINVAHAKYPNLLTSSSTAWKSVASARSPGASSIGHDDYEGHPSLPPPSGNAQTQSSKQTGMQALAGMFRLGRKSRASPGMSIPRVHEKNAKMGDKGKNKEENQPREEDIPRPEIGNSSNLTTSRPNSVSSSRPTTLRSGHVGREQAADRLKFSLSCCSANLFSDGVGQLGHHGFLLR